jgi:hypothetical protein
MGEKSNGKKKTTKLEYTFDKVNLNKPGNLQMKGCVKVQRSLAKEKGELKKIVHGSADAPTDILFHLSIAMKPDYKDDGLIDCLKKCLTEALAFDI